MTEQLDSILNHAEQVFHFVLMNPVPVSGGWLNRKWRADSEHGPVLIKQFSEERYSADRLAALESAMKRSGRLYDYGIKAPRYYSTSGSYLQRTGSGETYMLMDFIPGHAESPETVTERQMESLGNQCGALHAHWRQEHRLLDLPFEPEGGRELLARDYPIRLREAEASGHEVLLQALLKQRRILDSMGEDPFRSVPTGITHCDFSADNLLFDEGGVSALLDFDRNRHTWQWQDIGRAMLSFAYQGGELKLERIDAFISGYRRHLPLERKDIRTVLRLTWCIEANWWLTPSILCGEPAPKIKRFAEELLWVTDHWDELDALLC
ncbi:phosphotransferase enzyme family protein [Gorillibacterium timonense]|uniref:phosphotransferase enzyme family protein n=1 Tax=Gorillibacterium timonense TaxID=1689269 RepID=UPI00071C52C4|nr:phosphotransferase [Gorillibacterium timonense]